MKLSDLEAGFGVVEWPICDPCRLLGPVPPDKQIAVVDPKGRVVYRFPRSKDGHLGAVAEDCG